MMSGKLSAGTWPVFLLIAVLKITMAFPQASQPDPYHYTTNKSARFSKAAVASAHPLASEAGVLMLKKGGNSFDAAVATQLTLAVVYPGAGNLGGGGFLMARDQKGKTIALDFRERAPGKATETMYLDSAGNVMDDASKTGALASGVPGTVAGIFATLPFCKLPLRVLIEPAITFAEKGFTISGREAEGLNKAREDFIKFNTHASPFVKADLWKAGDTLIQKDLANTLKLIRDKGKTGFYGGKCAELIVRMMNQGNGIITANDLQRYNAIRRIPVEFNYRGYRVISFPPPSSGGILLGQMLKMTEKFPIRDYGFQSTKAVQLMTEIERRAYADRSEHMGDPDFYKVPVKALLSDKYLSNRMSDYQAGRAGSSEAVRPGVIKESRETTHISIIDKDGNMVSVTTTLNGSYGSRVIVEGAGFILNNEMDDFSVKPGVPNMYGAIGGKANAIQPGKTMLSSMTPTLMLNKNKPFMVLGTPGGTTIPTSVYQTIVNIVDFKMNIREAVNKPKFHHQWLPDEIDIEPGFDPETSRSLQRMGYKIVENPAIGRMEVIICNGNLIEACGDRRGDDSVAGE